MTDYLLAMLESATPERPLGIQDAITRLWFLYQEVGSERGVKAAIAELRQRGHVIGARRSPPCGYYLVRDEEERKAALRAYEAQIWTSLRTFRAMAPPARVREVVEQMRLEVDG